MFATTLRLMPTRVLFWVSAAGLSALVAIVAVQGVVVPGFDPGEQRVSEFAHSPAAALLVVGLLAWSLSLLSLAGLTLAVARSRGGPDRLACVQTAALLTAAASIALLAFFPTDRGEEIAAVVSHTTAVGRVHDAASGLAAVGLLAAALVGAVRRNGWVRVVTLALLAAGIASTVILLAAGDPLPGLRQRLLLAVGCLWQVAWLLELRGEAVATSPRSSAGSRCSTS